LIESSGAATGKRELRDGLRAQRQALPASARMQAAEAIADHLQDHPAFAGPGYVAGYWAMAGEMPLHVLQMRLQPQLIWCLPCIQPDHSLRFAPWRPGDELVSNRFGIPEPSLASESLLPAEAMAVILLPLLGFSRAGGRLGMGGGYYDRSLGFRQRRPSPPLLIGVGYAFQELPALPTDPWDIRLDAVVTEREFLLCRPAG
jgi:5-formyltetrahydrofolate cyclo-ligase